MDVISRKDLERMSTRELAAFQNEILKAIAQAADTRRKATATLDSVNRVLAQRRAMHPKP